MPLADLLRRMSAQGVRVERFQEDGYVFTKGIAQEVHFLDDPVPFEIVKNLANRFGLDRLRLYFDRTEGDLH